MGVRRSSGQDSGDGKRSRWTTSSFGTRSGAADAADTECVLRRPSPSEGFLPPPSF